MLKRFKYTDIFYNRIKAYPRCSFFFHNNQIFYNEKPNLKGQFTGSTFPNNGKISLYEMNVDRTSAQLIYPFITKNGSLTSFKTISTNQFNSDFSYGDTLTGSYPLEAGLKKTHYAANASRPQINALRNTLNYYKPLSPHYAYDNSSSFSLGDKSVQELSQLDIPSIFFGSSIKKGSVVFKHHQSGSLKSELRDIHRNGELIEVGPSGSAGTGSVAGVVLYNEGFILLTGSWTLASGFQWRRFASVDNSSSSFDLFFEGTSYVSTITMLCHASKGEFNFSNNPTFLAYGQTSSMSPISSSYSYKEPNNLTIKNIVESLYSDPTASFQKQTYISRVGIFDENKNLIAIARLARPVRKRQDDSYTIKLKLDI